MEAYLEIISVVDFIYICIHVYFYYIHTYIIVLYVLYTQIFKIFNFLAFFVKYFLYIRIKSRVLKMKIMSSNIGVGE